MRDKAKLLKDELDPMESLGVIKLTGNSKWGLGAFGTPKKDSTIQVVANLRALNKFIRPRQYPMPIVLDLLQKQIGYKFFSKLDIFKLYRTMLYGAELHIYTEHKNLTFDNFNTQRVLHWRCYIKEYHPWLFYIKGKSNILADAFS